MKTKNYLTILSLCLATFGSAQDVNYKITRDAPSFAETPNLFIGVVGLLDAPLYSSQYDFGLDAISSLSFGGALHSHAIVKERFLADFTYGAGVGFFGGNFRKLEIGGGLIVNSTKKRKNLKVTLSEEEISREKVALSNKQRVTTKVNYIEVPGTVHSFTALRGGFYHNSHYFEGTLKKTDIDIAGQTNSYGIYAGISYTRVTNLAIRITGKAGEKGNQSFYRHYLDVLLTGNQHNFTEGDGSGSPIGFRLGRDTFLPTTGVFAYFTNIEIGYRPGFTGFYTSIGMGFQIRSKIRGLDKKVSQNE